MAQIDTKTMREIKKKIKPHNKIQTTYTVAIINGEKYVQFDMYGGEHRKNPETISQTIQFDMESAQRLVELLCEEFALK